MKILHIENDSWLEEAVEFCSENNVLCLGESHHIQWFGTNLSKALVLKGKTEVSELYGKLINTLDDFCYQLCHSTPWGFEMGRNGNAVVDVLRGEATIHQKFFIWHDANHLLNKDRKLFLSLYEMMIERSIEKAKAGLTQESIFLFPNTEYAEIKKLLSNKGNHKVEIIEVET